MLTKTFQENALYLITDRGLIGDQPLTSFIEEVIEGGVTAVQLREKEASTREFALIARSLMPLLAKRNIPLIINDRVDVAFVVGADGVHVGQSDMACDEARRLLGPAAFIGLSIENESQVAAAESAGADYWGVGPIYPTASKADAAQPLGIEALRRICNRARVPVLGIGGITPQNVGDVMRAGANGIAAISAICGRADPRQAALDLSQAMCAQDRACQPA